MNVSKFLEKVSFPSIDTARLRSPADTKPVRTDTPSQRLESAKRQAHEKFKAAADAVAANLPARAREIYQTSVQERWDHIQQKIFSPLSSQVSKRDFARTLGKAIEKAKTECNAAAQRLQIDAERSAMVATRTETRALPQLIQKKDGSFTLIRKAPLIENLVLRGGGAKGISYGAALEQYQQTGYLDGLKRIAGSSAGALTATCLACGVSASRFDKIESEQLFKSAITTYTKDTTPIYPDLTFTESKGILTALSAVRTVDTTTAEHAHQYLTTHFNTTLFQDRLVQVIEENNNVPDFAQHVVTTLQRLLEKPDFEHSREGKMITFRDLSLLHQLAPDTFKELSLTAWDPHARRLVYFDKDNTPDIPVCYAARSSMSFPVAFKPVAMDLGDGSGKRTLIDGGLGSNLPTEAFDLPNSGVAEKELNAAKTLLFVFDMDGMAYQAMTSGGVATDRLREIQQKTKTSRENSLIARIHTWFLGRDFSKTRLEDNEKVWNAGPNAVPIFHGTIRTTTPHISTSRAHAARLQAATAALEQIRQRESQGWYVHCNSLEEVANQLSVEEKASVINSTDPSLQLLATHLQNTQATVQHGQHA